MVRVPALRDQERFPPQVPLSPSARAMGAQVNTSRNTRRHAISRDM